MITKNVKRAWLMMISVLLVFTLSITCAYSALFSSATSTGTITFENMYNIVVSKNGNVNLSSPNVTFTNKLFNGSASAVISLSETTTTATSLNNGSITGNFTKYAWQVASSDLNSTELLYQVYAREDYTYYPKLKILLQYTSNSSGYDSVHLSLKTTQSDSYTIVDDAGKMYYSYSVTSSSGENYLVTFPIQSVTNGNTYLREITIIQIDGGYAKKMTGQGKTIKNYEMVLNDIMDGVYFETSNKPSNVTLTTTFEVDKEPTFN